MSSTPSPSGSQEPRSTQTVRVTTVAYNTGPELERFLDSLQEATRMPVTTVIADNGQEHDVVDRLAARYGARVVRDGRNHGYGGGANRAAEGVTEDWIVVANPDVVWLPGSLDRLIDAALADPTAGCLGPRILSTDGTVYPSGRALPTLGRGAGHALLSRVWPSNPFSAAYHTTDGPQTEGTRTVGWLSGACLLLPAHVWQDLGGFDDSYFMFFEDVDLGARVSAKGLRNVQVRQAVIVHEQGASWKARPEAMIRAHHASARHYLDGVYSRPWQAPVRAVVHAGLRLREEAEVRLAARARGASRP